MSDGVTVDASAATRGTVLESPRATNLPKTPDEARTQPGWRVQHEQITKRIESERAPHAELHLALKGRSSKPLTTHRPIGRNPSHT